MGITFYTTRLVLNALGVVDYGLVNAIGCVSSAFTVISTSLSSACSRYFSYELGRKDYESLNRVFSLMVILYAIAGLIFIAASETIGLWYVCDKLVYPPERRQAVLWFYQCTIGMMVAGWMAIPYSSLVISYEDMGTYAWLSILDVIVKLLAAIGLLMNTQYDALILYGHLLFASAILHAIVYLMIVHTRYEVGRFKWYFDKRKAKEVSVFSGWNFYGILVWVTSESFVNLLLNAFFGPIVNAARAVAVQVNNGINSFTLNFLTASRPQIVKLWAEKEKDAAWILYTRVCKIGYILLFVFVAPVVFELPEVLSLWLKAPPENAVVFTRLVLVTTLINSFSHPSAYLMQAVGKMALFEGIGSGARIFILPASYIALKLGAAAVSVCWIGLAFTFLCVILRVIILLKGIGKELKSFMSEVLKGLIGASIIVVLALFLVHSLMTNGLIRLFVSCVTSAILSFFAFIYIAFKKEERLVLFMLVVERFKR